MEPSQKFGTATPKAASPLAAASIRLAAPVGRDDRERHAHQQAEGGRGQGQAERDRRAVPDRLDHRLAGAERHAEVAPRHPPEPAPVLHDERAG